MLDEGVIKRIDFEEFKNKKQLAEGGFGIVYTAYWVTLRSTVVYKKLIQPTWDEKTIDAFIDEVERQI